MIHWFAVLQGQSFRVQGIEEESSKSHDIPRGNIRGFSRQSRVRLLRWLNSILWPEDHTSLFVTLTYPDSEITFKYRDRMNQLNYFHKQMERNLGKKIPLLWRQEWVPRKSGKFTGKLMPHFHLLLFGVGYIHYTNINLWWRIALNYDEPPLATDVEKVTGEDGAIRYVAKYLAKNPSLDIRSYLDNRFRMGRFWGIRRRKLIAIYPTEIIELTDLWAQEKLMHDAAHVLKRPATWIEGGFTILGKQGVKLFRDLQTSS